MDLDSILEKANLSPDVISQIKSVVKLKEAETNSKIDALTSRIKQDRVNIAINEFIGAHPFNLDLRDGIESILRNKVTVNDDLSVTFDGKDTSTFGTEWLKSSGKNYLKPLETVGGGATNSNKSVQPVKKNKTDHDIFLDFVQNTYR